MRLFFFAFSEGGNERKKGQTFPQKHQQIHTYLFSIHAHKTHTERERTPLLSPPFERI
jgi:hypothetical protein